MAQVSTKEPTCRPICRSMVSRAKNSSISNMLLSSQMMPRFQFTTDIKYEVLLSTDNVLQYNCQFFFINESYLFQCHHYLAADVFVMQLRVTWLFFPSCIATMQRGNGSFAVVCPSFWNRLPCSLQHKLLPAMSPFHKQLKTMIGSMVKGLRTIAMSNRAFSGSVVSLCTIKQYTIII